MRSSELDNNVSRQVSSLNSLPRIRFILELIFMNTFELPGAYRMVRPASITVVAPASRSKPGSCANPSAPITPRKTCPGCPLRTHDLSPLGMLIPGDSDAVGSCVGPDGHRLDNRLKLGESGSQRGSAGWGAFSGHLRAALCKGSQNGSRSNTLFFESLRKRARSIGPATVLFYAMIGLMVFLSPRSSHFQWNNLRSRGHQPTPRSIGPE
jgi:hypothetical protein